MSSSIAIPKRKKNSMGSSFRRQSIQSSEGSSSASLSGPDSFPQLLSNTGGPSTTPLRANHHDRRPCLLGSSLSKSEHTVINVGHPDAPRLLSYVKASQGFDWNQEIFLPSHVEYDSVDLERKQDPVEDIILTDEEAAAILPQ